MNRKTVTLLTLTAAALFTFNVTGSVEAAGTEKQVSFLSEQAPVWSTAPFYADWLRGRSSRACYRSAADWTETAGWNCFS